MEKEKLSMQLKGLVGENSLSERTWDDYLENSVMPFLPSEEEKAGDFLGKHANVLKSINGQLNNEVATRVNEFKKSYKPEPQKQVNQPEPQKQPQGISDEKLNELESRLQKFEEAQVAKNAAQRKKMLLDDAKKLMKEQGASNETVLELILAQLEISESSQAEDLAKAGKAGYDKAYSELYGDSYVPVLGGSSYGRGSKKEKDSYMKHLKETGRISD